MSVSVSFIIATYNRGTVLLSCLERVMACGLAREDFEILLVDNASTDATPRRVAEAYPDVNIIALEKNLGATAKNRAIARARGEFLVFLDDDSYPLPGALPVMLEHFRADPALAAAIFDVRLLDGTAESSAYPDVFIGAGTGLRRSLLAQTGLLPEEYFMQVEEYDLSFRILEAGGKIQRFADMPVEHLKAPGARIAQRTTRLDVRNNLFLLAKFVPSPLAETLATEWLTRYWAMALQRDRRESGAAHRGAFMRGAAVGLELWEHQRAGGKKILSPATIEQIFRLERIEKQWHEARQQWGFKRVVLADWGKNIWAWYRAARENQSQILAVCDDQLQGHRYRELDVLPWSSARELPFDAILVSNLSPVHGKRRLESLRALTDRPVIWLGL